MSIEDGLAAAATRAARAIAAAVPRDVDVDVDVDGRTIALTGRGLAGRSLLDPRLRDFAAVAR